MTILWFLTLLFVFTGHGMAIYYEQKLTEQKIRYNELLDSTRHPED